MRLVQGSLPSLIQHGIGITTLMSVHIPVYSYRCLEDLLLSTKSDMNIDDSSVCLVKQIITKAKMRMELNFYFVNVLIPKTEVSTKTKAENFNIYEVVLLNGCEL